MLLPRVKNLCRGSAPGRYIRIANLHTKHYYPLGIAKRFQQEASQVADTAKGLQGGAQERAFLHELADQVCDLQQQVEVLRPLIVGTADVLQPIASFFRVLNPWFSMVHLGLSPFATLRQFCSFTLMSVTQKKRVSWPVGDSNAAVAGAVRAGLCWSRNLPP